MDLTIIKKKFRQLVIQRAIENGWSYKMDESGVRLIDNLGVAGDHWDGKTFDRFFAFSESSLINAIAFCSVMENSED